jgi:MoCo/4Fe-4S cofactor protein with predicted Tat translocation signal
MAHGGRGGAVSDGGGERPRPLDLATVRERLARARGPQYWRSLEELAGSDGFRELLEREFPRFAAEWPAGFSRRSFLELAGASLALAGLTACTRQPAETIVPYVRQPENIVPGRPLYYATAMELSGAAIGLLVESHMGRPTKAEGNPEHPGSLGATDVFAQASLLDLYDPDRAQVVSHLGRVDTWGNFFGDLKARVEALGALGGEGLRFLTGTVASPTLGAQLGGAIARFPKARWHQYEPCGRHAARAAARDAFGAPAELRYDLSRADVIVALDADFLTSGPGWVRTARDFARRRKVHEDAGAGMNRLYAVESAPTATSAQADHRLALPPAQVGAFAAALAAALGVAEAAGAGASQLPEEARAWVAAVAADLTAHRGAGLVLAGEEAPPAVHVLAHAINQRLGNLGTTAVAIEPVEAAPVDQLASIRELAADMAAGAVDTLIILGGNPVYDAPADCDFAAAMEKVARRVHLSLYDDETSNYCHWQLPAAHYLESWSDTRAFDGTASIVQPLIAPLYGGRTAHEVLALFGDTTDATAYELVRAHWQGRGLGGGDFEGAWKKALNDGVIPATAAAEKAVTVAPAAVARAVAAVSEAAGAAASGYELAFRPDPGVYDGRFANNGWLQELPRPLTRLTWDNAVAMSPRTAEALGVGTEDLVDLDDGQGRQVTGPVWVLPGHADGCLTVHLGFGRERAGRVGNGAGFSAYRLRTSGAPWVARGVAVRRREGTYPLASTQSHWDMELQTREAAERHLVRHGTLEQFRRQPDFVSHIGHPPPAADESLYPGFDYPDYAWALSVDLSSCVGCNACVVACQSENNIPVVGKEQVLAGREMHWIRIDRYFEGELEDPAIHHQPVMCMHCEQAPCEVVCPVGATVHSPEGLNVMVYNRCVGTRYCSNNCPYKVRRFNFFLYSDFDTEVLKMGRNPDVTVRSRGVMEKCSYCLQRINQARIAADREGRKIREGEITTACQQACPADAIVFGNLGDADSRVRRWKASPLDYGLLTDLNTRPRTTYLAKLSNPNPALAGGGEEKGA